VNKPPTTFLTIAEWHDRIEAASATATDLIAIVERMTTGPGQSVLALMLAARALCVAFPALPSLEWYFRRVADLAINTRPPPTREPPS
jgi:hypothetical protein